MAHQEAREAFRIDYRRGRGPKVRMPIHPEGPKTIHIDKYRLCLAVEPATSVVRLTAGTDLDYIAPTGQEGPTRLDDIRFFSLEPGETVRLRAPNTAKWHQIHNPTG